MFDAWIWAKASSLVSLRYVARLLLLLIALAWLGPVLNERAMRSRGTQVVRHHFGSRITREAIKRHFSVVGMSSNNVALST